MLPKNYDLSPCDTRQSKRLPFLCFFPLAYLVFSKEKKIGRELVGSSSFFFSFLFFLSFSLSPVFPPSFATTLRRCPNDRSDYPDAFSTRRGPWMDCCSAVSTGSQRSLTTERLPRDCGLSRIPSPPGRSAPSTGLPCVPSRPRCDRTDLVRAAKQNFL